MILRSRLFVWYFLPTDIMKTLLSSLLLFVFCVNMAFADAELDRLKTSYEAAVERSVAPLRTTYEKELLKLMDHHTKAGNLTAALEVKNEIEQLTGKPYMDPSAPKPTTTAITKPKILEQYFVGKTWRTPSGTNYTFNEDGKGFRQFGNDKSDFKWKQRGKDIVEVVGPASQGGSDTTWFFKFVSLEEAYYGKNKDTTDAKLSLKP